MREKLPVKNEGGDVKKVPAGNKDVKGVLTIKATGVLCWFWLGCYNSVNNYIGTEEETVGLTEPKRVGVEGCVVYLGPWHRLGYSSICGCLWVQSFLWGHLLEKWNAMLYDVCEFHQNRGVGAAINPSKVTSFSCTSLHGSAQPELLSNHSLQRHPQQHLWYTDFTCFQCVASIKCVTEWEWIPVQTRLSALIRYSASGEVGWGGVMREGLQRAMAQTTSVIS